MNKKLGFAPLMKGNDGKRVKSEVVIVPDATGIAHPTTDAPTSKNGVYTLDGVYLGTHVESLPRGVYIVGGKKIVKN
ncbi:hypothetical protein ACQRD6_11440 [Prevotella sp. SGI.027]